MLKKITIFAVLAFTIFLSSPALAAVDSFSQIPELNPFCWRRIDCDTVRKQFGTSNDKSGFITGASVEPCKGGDISGGPEEWGRCLPAGTSKTEISFGGKDQFTNIGDFILVMYKYLLTIASIVAVVVVIIAGIQWVTSGGNSEAIGSAKKRIAGALVGLFIAYMSYFVLNTINPALVNLRLPQVWLIRPQALMPELCSDLPAKSSGQPRKFAYIAAADQPNAPIPPAASRDYKVQDSTALACGNRLLAEDGGEQVCRGGFCRDAGQACFDFKGDGTGYECGNVRMWGTISYTALVQRCGFFSAGLDKIADSVVSPWNCPPIASVALVPVCEKALSGETVARLALNIINGENIGIGTSQGADKNRYWITATPGAVEQSANVFCNGTPKGYAVRVKMRIHNMILPNETQVHFVGKGGIDLGNIFFLTYVHKIDPGVLFKIEDIVKGGIRLDIDAANISESADVKKYEKYFTP